MRFLLLLLLISCGPQEDKRDWRKTISLEPDYNVERQKPVYSLKVLIDEFLYDCGEIYGADVSDISKLEFIKYGDPATEEKPNRVGVCNTFSYGNRLTKSNITVRRYNEYVIQKGLVFHELGHCVLGLDHTEGDAFTIMSSSISPLINNPSYFEKIWDSLVEEMCTSNS